MKSGYKKTEFGEIPEEWNLISIGDICTLEYGSALKRNERDGGKYPVYGSNGLVGNHDSYNAKGPGILVGRKGSIGSIHLCNTDFWAIDTTYFIKFKQKDIDLKYFYYLLNKLDLSKMETSSAIPGLNRDIVYRRKTVMPPIIEQNKIAKVLSTVDDAISMAEEKIQKTERLKKGMMQKLLTRGIGHKKFKKTELGEIPEEWEVVRLGDFSYIKARIGWRALSSKEYTKSGPYLIAGNHIENGKVIWNRCQHISIERYEESHEIILKEKDIIISKDGTIGRVAYIDELPDKATINGTMMLIRTDEKLYDAEFVFQYFQSNNFTSLIKEKISGSSIPHLFQRDIVNFKIVKLSIIEQREIASIISNIDKQLNIEENRKGKFELLKKGLINVLLTGKQRIKRGIKNDI